MRQRLIDANALIEYCNNLIDKTIDANDIARFPTAVGWVSVEDRLPKENGRYLCWFGKNTLCVGADIATYLPRWHGFGILETDTILQNVTHWMPLPESPKEVTGDE